jgi:hypothetical protein
MNHQPDLVFAYEYLADFDSGARVWGSDALVGPDTSVDKIERHTVHLWARDVLISEVQLDVGSDKFIGYRRKQLMAGNCCQILELSLSGGTHGPL